MTIRVLSVVGARPQFVKAAPVSRALETAGLREVVVHTGQHFDAEMSDVFFHELELPAPAINLGIGGGSPGAMTGQMLGALESVMLSERPDIVLVYGDTNSTLAGALAAAKLRLPIAHIEAGLRSFNRAMPEEVNRVIADHVSTLLFCPTNAAMANAANEGLTDRAVNVGDVMYDAVIYAADRARRSSDVLERLALSEQSYAVATAHRAENTDTAEALGRVISYLEKQEMPVVLPLHPRTRLATERHGLCFSSVRVIPPLGYLDMTHLVANARVVLTDSGGLQKEAYFHRVPCVTLRDETEWVETIAAGWNRLWTVEEYAPRNAISEYGDGHASVAIVEVLRDYLRTE